MRFRKLSIPLSVAVLFASYCTGQENDELQSPSPAKVYVAGKGTTVPTPLPNEPFKPITLDCKLKLSGSPRLSFIVDTEGQVRNVLLNAPAWNDLDRLAVRILEKTRFVPAKRDNVPVAVSEIADFRLDGCYIVKEDPSGQKHLNLHLLSEPVVKFSSFHGYPDNVVFARDYGDLNSEDFRQKWILRVASGAKGPTAPVPMNSPEAKMTEEARKKRISGECMVTLIVDTHGLPQHPVVVRSLEPGLDINAVAAVNEYRFKPAIRNGNEPVPVLITVAVNFHL